jgi:hypothetical protein
VQRLAGVLLEVDAPDPDAARLASLSYGLEKAIGRERLLEL